MKQHRLIGKIVWATSVFLLTLAVLVGSASLNSRALCADSFYSSLALLWQSEDIGAVRCVVIDDVDVDGTAEIIAGTMTRLDSSPYTYHGYVYIFNALTYELEWQSDDIGHLRNIIVADLEGDGGKDIIVQTDSRRSAIIGNCYGYIYVFDGTSHEQIWKSNNIGEAGGLAVADLDDNGVKEIIAGGTDYYSCTRHGHVYVFDGADFSQKWQSADVNSTSVIVVADADDDGVKEIIFGNCVTDCAYSSGEGGWYYPGYVYVFDGMDFTQEWQSGDIGVLVNLVINDIDDDGTKELIAGIIRASEPNVERDRGYVYIFDGRTYSQEWRSSNVDTPYGLRVDDSDNDGTEEIIARTAQPHTADMGAGHIGHLYVFDGETRNQEWSSDNLGDGYCLEVNDIDNNGVKEILTTVLQDTGWHIRIVGGMTYAQEWQSTEDSGRHTVNLVITDLTGDGHKEIVVGGGEVQGYGTYPGHLYIFSSAGGAAPQCVETATGTGTACFSTSNGTIEDLQAVAAPSGAPVEFPHGMFTFKITGLSNGEAVTLTVELPDPVPAGTKWWKYHNNTWSAMDIGDDDGDNVITVALKDGRTPDDEDTTPGQITDQGGPGSPGSVGWKAYPANKVRVLLPWISLVAAIIAAVSLLVVSCRGRGPGYTRG